MTAATLSYARSTGRPRRLVLDAWVIGTVAALLLVGLGDGRVRVDRRRRAARPARVSSISSAS